MSKRIFSVYFDDDLLDAIDDLRGNTSRSQYINNLIRYELSQKTEILGDSS